MTTIYLTRHGETMWNLEKRLQGWMNSPLTKDGIIQAKRLSERLDHMGLDVIYSSTSERAHETAIILKGNKDIEIILEAELKELAFGSWEGKTLDELATSDEYGKEYHNLFNNPSRYKPFGGETLKELEQRALNVMNKIIKENQGKTVLVVTHGITLKALIAFFQNMNLEDLIIEEVMGQTSLTKIVIENHKHVIEFKNNTDHYPKNYKKKGW